MSAETDRPDADEGSKLPRHCHPLTVSAKILRIFGRGDCKEAVSRGKNRPAPTAHVAGLD